jgi:hypothetical protein
LRAAHFIRRHWARRDTVQFLLKFGLLFLPLAALPAQLLTAFSVATGVLFLVFAYVQISKGETTAKINGWDDAHFRVEITGYQASAAIVGAWAMGTQRRPEIEGLALTFGVTLALLAWERIGRWGGAYPLVARLGVWALGLAIALLTSAVLGKTGWMRAELIFAAAYLAYAAGVHLHAWLVKGELSMGHVGPSLWHDLAFPAVAAWVLLR